MHYSPILAMATAAFEVVVALWALGAAIEWTRQGEAWVPHLRWNRCPGCTDEQWSILRTTSAVLLFLAGYQIVEVLICRSPATAGFLPRLAFIVVTWLPPLGLMLIARLHRPPSRLIRRSAVGMLAAAAGIVVWIAADRGFASASVCNTVYARYAHAMPRFSVYAWFYWLGLFGMVLFSGWSAVSSATPRRRREQAQVFYGTLAFVVPGILTSWLVPAARGALPSILCHYALFLAVFLARLVHLVRQPDEEADVTTAPAAQRG